MKDPIYKTGSFETMNQLRALTRAKEKAKESKQNSVVLKDGKLYATVNKKGSVQFAN